MLLSLADRDKPSGMVVARRFAELGFGIVATAGTATALEAEGLIAEAVIGRLTDGDGADGIDAVELLNSGKIDLVVNTPRGRGARADGAHIRRTATARGIPCVTTVAAALAASAGHRRVVPPRARGALPAGVPPRRPAPPRRLMRAPWHRTGVGKPAMAWSADASCVDGRSTWRSRSGRSRCRTRS